MPDTSEIRFSRGTRHSLGHDRTTTQNTIILHLPCGRREVARIRLQGLSAWAGLVSRAQLNPRAASHFRALKKQRMERTPITEQYFQSRGLAWAREDTGNAKRRKGTKEFARPQNLVTAPCIMHFWHLFFQYLVRPYHNPRIDVDTGYLDTNKINKVLTLMKLMIGGKNLRGRQIKGHRNKWKVRKHHSKQMMLW